jgi:hypothetical protein
MACNDTPGLHARAFCQVLLSGWLRRDGGTCEGGAGAGGRRAASVSFILDPATLDRTRVFANGSLEIVRAEEMGEDPFDGLNRSYSGYPIDGDGIYCAGHAPLADGRVFFTGGSRYAFMSQAYEHEWGLNYSRIFDPVSRRFVSTKDRATKQHWRMPFDTAWYPTTSVQPDGRVLVAGGFSAYGTDTCVGAKCANPQVAMFDPKAYDGGQDPWTLLIDKEHADHALDPGIREYTRLFVLPKPFVADGYVRQVLAMGKAGVVVLINTDNGTPMGKRLFKPPGGKRPGSDCGDASDQSTALPLLTNQYDAELLVVGGCSGTTLQKIDLYSVTDDIWRSFDSGVFRAVPASILLPDGRVLLVSGENLQNAQQEHLAADESNDPRYPQIFDPETRTITTEYPSNGRDSFRGYHNMAALLKDGTILVGGGFNWRGDVGCENPNLRLFYPSYLAQGARPILLDVTNSSAPLILQAGDTLSLRFSGARLHPTKGVALLAVNAFTHSYCHNQRYVRLHATSLASSSVTLEVPDVPILIPGQHFLFLISEDGVPSIARHVEVIAAPATVPPATVPPATAAAAGSSASVTLPIALVAAIGAVALCVVIAAWVFALRSRHSETLRYPGETEVRL